MAAAPVQMCSSCGQPGDEVDRLIAGQSDHGHFLCVTCRDRATEHPRAPREPPTTGLATLGVRELRNQVAGAVRRAAEGERIVITVDGRPMAQLGPLAASGPPTLADLAAAGLVEPPRTAQPASPVPPEDLPVDVRIDAILEELRGR